MRRRRHCDKITIRQIAKRTGLSRNTVRKCLASGVVELKYSRPTGLQGARRCAGAWYLRRYEDRC
ncbi:helix-turn-helix domain-containing protein [Candidatus Vondammii sp. HM_W22]|uniref:helix-turn-helix domain-containing protein n=1 Tax=Candidatus Vondammii sp. HM_W22 TaxID=2687299 RepID=UPI001F137B03|nr:helix-turn-helix domain-containing protein [Candidatus Vondammii sp. HM_W22]